MGPGRELDANGVARGDGPSALHHAHDPGPAHELAVRIAADGDLQQARTKVIDLLAGVAQARHPHDRLIAQVQAGIARQCQRVQPCGQDILAKVPLGQFVSVLPGLVEELGLDQVNLTQIGLRGIRCYPRAVLHGDAGVGVALDA
jgi:hypothetical protein